MQPTGKETLKQALISIAIGAVISFLTVLFQFGIEWLNSIPAEFPGAIVGMLRYVTKWKSNLLV